MGGLDRVLSLQGSVLGEFLDLKTLFFSTCAVMLCLALTAVLSIPINHHPAREALWAAASAGSGAR